MSTFVFLSGKKMGPLGGPLLSSRLFGTKMICGSLSHVRANGCFLAMTKVSSNLRVCVANCALLSHSWLCQFKVANRVLVCITPSKGI
jgi:hypothetical protein